MRFLKLEELSVEQKIGMVLCGRRWREEDIEFMDLSKQISVNLTEGVLAGKYISTVHEYVLLLSKCVSLAIGFNPFNFLTNGKTSNYTPEEFKKVPQIEDLQRNISLEEN